VAAIRPSQRIFTPGSRLAGGFPAPILIVQPDPDPTREVHSDERLVDRIATKFQPGDFLARVDGLIRMQRAVSQQRVEARCNDASAVTRVEEGVFARFGNRISSILNTRVPRYRRPRAPYASVAARVADWADRRDAFAPGHAERVARLVAQLAHTMGLPDDETAATLRAAALHDIGKVALPLEILRQRGPLAEDQKRLIRTHPERGAAILDALNMDAPVVAAIRYHHERFDGQGFFGKKGIELPRSARILAVAEVFDAMTSSELVPAMDAGAALEKMADLRGGQLDPECVDALRTALRRRRAAQMLKAQRLGAIPR
jgi:putative nucleotidyltransferase with HDIG domain